MTYCSPITYGFMQYLVLPLGILRLRSNMNTMEYITFGILAFPSPSKENHRGGKTKPEQCW